MIVTSVEAGDSLLSVVEMAGVCDETAAVDGDEDSAGSFVTSDVLCVFSVVEPILSVVEDKDSAGSFVTCDGVCGPSVMEPLFSAVEDEGELLTGVTNVLFISVPVTDFIVVIFDADVLVTSIEAVDSLLSVVKLVGVCDESSEVVEDEDSAGSLVTSDVICGSSVMEPLFSAVEDEGELLTGVTNVLFVSVPVTDFIVVIFDADVIVTSVEAVDSLLSVVKMVGVCDESSEVVEDEDSAGSLVTSDVVCGSSVVELLLSAVEDEVKTLNEVLPVLVA